MRWLAMVFDFLFGCRHCNLSRVFSIAGESYKVCWDCGAKFSYSLANMSIEHGPHAFRFHTRQDTNPALRDAQALRGAR
jgi:hypothetical protein